MTVTAVLELALLPASVTDGLSVLRDTLRVTRAFPGCLGVEILLDADDATHVLVIERWTSLDSDAAYRAWRATPDGASQLPTVLASPPRLTKFTSAAEI
jgi:heme oxygenase (mycobilin-producing)